MSKPASNADRHRMSSRGLMQWAAAALGAGIAILAAGVPASAQAPAKEGIPALASVDFAWLAMGVHWFDPPAGLGRGPIRQDAAYPYHGNLDGPGQVTPDIGNVKDPV